MSKRAARIGDLIRHGPPTHVIVTGSPNVITEAKQQARRGDLDNYPHAIVRTSSTVLVNGRGAARITDIDSGSGVIITGAATVFIGD